MEITDTERIDALHRWAQRLLSQTPPPTAVDRREDPRERMDGQLTLIPAESTTLLPQMDAKIVVVIRDQSERGFGVLTDSPLPGEVFFAESEGSEEILLLRRVRKRRMPKGVLDYGMQILGRYDSFAALRES